MDRRAWLAKGRVSARRMRSVTLAMILGAVAIVGVVGPAVAASGAVVTVRSDDPPPAYPAPKPTEQRLAWAFRLSGPDGLDLAGSALNRGDSITLHATGLPGGAFVAVELHSTPLPMGAATVTPEGDLTLVVTVPDAAESGAHEVVATLTALGYEPSIASAAVTVNDAVVVPPLAAAAPAIGGIVAPETPVEAAAAVSPTPEPTVVVEAVTAPDPVAPTEPEPAGIPTDEYPWLAPHIPTADEIFEVTPFRLAVTAGLASAFLLLAAIPAELLQSTLTENYGRAFGWLTPWNRHPERAHRHLLPPALRRPWFTCGVTVSFATLILGFGQAGWRWDRDAIIGYVSLLLSLTVLNLALNLGRLTAARKRLDLPGVLTPMPGALVVVTVSVVISQVLNIEPALLFGAVVAVRYGGSLTSRRAGQLALIGVGSAFVLGVASWLLLSVLESVFAGSDAVGVLLVEETLAGLVLETLAALVVGLLPFTYLDGKSIHDWNRRVWAGAYFIAAMAFVLIAVPTGDDWSDSQTPLLTWLGIVGGFAVIALTAWAVFRIVPDRTDDDAAPGAAAAPPQKVDA